MAVSAATLNRVSSSFRRGYQDGHAGRPHIGERTDGPLDRPFADFDYDEGYKGGANDAKWEALAAAMSRTVTRGR